MPRLELSLQTDYVPNWHAAEGIREFLSNAYDAEVQFGAKMKVDWYNNPNAEDEQKRIGVLRIENDGTTLPREALLFGYTTKTGAEGVIGRHAEGMKTGALALIRNGHDVVIRSGSETWRPAIERSDKFEARVLVFNITDGHKYENRVRVEIAGIGREVYDTLKDKFLFLNTDPLAAQMRFKVSSGELLIAPELIGKVFVRGVFVKNAPENQYGYNLFDCPIDRDRRMVDTYDLQSCVNRIWQEALAKHPTLVATYFSMFEENKEDVAGVNEYNAGRLPAAMLDHSAAAFVAKYGEAAVPVLSMEESMDIEHYGKRGVVVNKSFHALLSTRLANFASVKKSMAHATKKVYSWGDLTGEEQTNLRQAVKLINSANPALTMENVDVVDFVTPGLDGLYKEGRVQVSKAFVTDFDDLLEVLIHEYSHHSTGAADGEKSHVAAIEKLWKQVFKAQRLGNT
jgi:hypothetical protein